MRIISSNDPEAHARLPKAGSVHVANILGGLTSSLATHLQTTICVSANCERSGP